MAIYIELNGDTAHRLEDAATADDVADDIRTSLNHNTAYVLTLHDGSKLVVPPSGVYVRLFDEPPEPAGAL